MHSPGKILISYDYFYPAYKAGGPIQSLYNLAVVLSGEYDVYVVTGCHDLGTTETLSGIKIGQWNSYELPGASGIIQVWYLEQGWPGWKQLRQIIKTGNFDTLYLNGMFSPRFLLLPMLLTDKKKTRVVVSPRGMLQKGALAGKSTKKKRYLQFIKAAGFMKRIYWHATNEEESINIRQQFGATQQVYIAPNVPKKPYKVASASRKVNNELRLVYLSLISAKKNLLQLVEAVVAAADHIRLDIYGPVKDKDYWEKIQRIIATAPHKIFYQGDVRPDKVQEILTGADVFVLLTHGENFGHAIYESLSVGRPVLLSHFTPWNNLESEHAGWNIDTRDTAEIVGVLNELRGMPITLHQAFCEGAHHMALAYYQETDFKAAYQNLFSANHAV